MRILPLLFVWIAWVPELILAEEPGLKDAFAQDFLVGTAIGPTHFSASPTDPTDEIQLLNKHFNAITAENAMKWDALQPSPGRYVFDQADAFVKFGLKKKMFIIGHTLVWHSQTPPWLFVDEQEHSITRDALLKRMREHIHQVMTRYKGQVRGWDVVNEALNDDGSLRQSPWLEIIGEDYIAKAFQFAHEADPQAELYYNDYSLEGEKKRAGAVKLLKKLKDAGVPITAVGLQGHYGLTYPSIGEIEKTIKAFAELGLRVMITELDINVLPTPGDGGADIATRYDLDPQWNPYPQELPPKVEEQLTQRYAELFSIFLKHRQDITRVTLWGISDRNSWLNNFPIRGRTNYPLLFDRDGKPKPALKAVLQTRLQMK